MGEEFSYIPAGPTFEEKVAKAEEIRARLWPPVVRPSAYIEGPENYSEIHLSSLVVVLPGGYPSDDLFEWKATHEFKHMSPDGSPHTFDDAKRVEAHIISEVGWDAPESLLHDAANVADDVICDLQVVRQKPHLRKFLNAKVEETMRRIAERGGDLYERDGWRIILAELLKRVGATDVSVPKKLRRFNKEHKAELDEAENALKQAIAEIDGGAGTPHELLASATISIYRANPFIGRHPREEQDEAQGAGGGGGGGSGGGGRGGGGSESQAQPGADANAGGKSQTGDSGGDSGAQSDGEGAQRQGQGEGKGGEKVEGEGQSGGAGGGSATGDAERGGGAQGDRSSPASGSGATGGGGSGATKGVVAGVGGPLSCNIERRFTPNGLVGRVVKIGMDMDLSAEQILTLLGRRDLSKERVEEIMQEIRRGEVAERLWREVIGITHGAGASSYYLYVNRHPAWDGNPETLDEESVDEEPYDPLSWRARVREKYMALDAAGEEESGFNRVLLIVDVSGSTFGRVFDEECRGAESVIAFAAKADIPVSVILFNENAVGNDFGRSYVDAAIYIEEARPTGATSLQPAIEEAESHMEPKSLVAVITDGLLVDSSARDEYDSLKKLAQKWESKVLVCIAKPKPNNPMLREIEGDRDGDVEVYFIDDGGLHKVLAERMAEELRRIQGGGLTR
jgi:hypothetical protein